MAGTLTASDIYGGGSYDTMGGIDTSEKTNPNNPDASGTVTKDKASIMHMKGNILGQPLFWWGGMIALLVLLKFIVEKGE